MAGVQRPGGPALTVRPLGPAEIRNLASELDLFPRKSLG
ncbi:MAG TPA: 16S rRNA (adenine(1518)-N(6)/adenine(1519)-N(6))-dimethyltransferase, partial [Mycobacterium sp.]|nr:16S rRNA (adenine(1518)-N(6)/adenine(1519)-N(6))-dimethyltransferase [Mycobacterium sp.]